jgi:TPR repeat protein
MSDIVIKMGAVIVDFSVAFKWYHLAANQGHENAQVNCGLCHENGKGAPKNKVKALEWYTKAAKQGNKFAQRKLARVGLVL